MTKRRQTTHSDTVDEPGTRGKVVHAIEGITDDVRMAVIEQLFEVNGPTAVAGFMAERLRGPSPPHWVIDAVARWLDPQSNDCFELVLKRRRDKKRLTTTVNDAAIAKAVPQIERELLEAGKPKHGIKGLAERKVAKIFKISVAKVRKVLRAIPK